MLIFAATIGSFANAQRINEIDANGLQTPHEPPKRKYLKILNIFSTIYVLLRSVSIQVDNIHNFSNYMQPSKKSMIVYCFASIHSSTLASMSIFFPCHIRVNHLPLQICFLHGGNHYAKQNVYPKLPLFSYKLN